eukprot:CAMPEP_0171093348 /NCGR_PEP_ID=MMETSP0766_2-20121228/39027_1 /TAXON_ID=439317 /ORGANISM="Gambierdiscus australes, Strain CAWD 149" /LENGTH=106 /DNA_ID=CAMNT_0011551781 /DNA_START=91 /DNA_END=411 /DNA_ORIENTATION=-
MANLKNTLNVLSCHISCFPVEAESEEELPCDDPDSVPPRSSVSSGCCCCCPNSFGYMCCHKGEIQPTQGGQELVLPIFRATQRTQSVGDHPTPTFGVRDVSGFERD